jgi:hypothetical protein
MSLQADRMHPGEELTWVWSARRPPVGPNQESRVDAWRRASSRPPLDGRGRRAQREELTDSPTNSATVVPVIVEASNAPNASATPAETYSNGCRHQSPPPARISAGTTTPRSTKCDTSAYGSIFLDEQWQDRAEGRRLEPRADLRRSSSRVQLGRGPLRCTRCSRAGRSAASRHATDSSYALRLNPVSYP